MIKKYDYQEGYCKKLGHFLTFAYCRHAQHNLPCDKVLDCWFQCFPVEKFITENYSSDEQKRIFAPPKAKVLSLTEILEQAQQRIRENKNK